MTFTDYGALLPRQCAKYKACEDFSVAEWDEVEENAALRGAPATRTRHLAWFADNRPLNQLRITIRSSPRDIPPFKGKRRETHKWQRNQSTKLMLLAKRS